LRCVWFIQTLRYSFRHSLFSALHQSLRSGFSAQRTLPYHLLVLKEIHSFGTMLFPFRRRRLSPAVSLTRVVFLAFGVWLGLVTSTWPLAHPVLYLQDTYSVAAPPCISGRTSYLHVRLAFHPYPQLISQFCNTGEFEPRRTFTSASLWPWIAHVVSGRITATLSPASDSVSLRLPSFNAG